MEKLLLLKQTESGFSINGKQLGCIVRIESEKGITDFHLSFMNVKVVSGGEYLFSVMGKTKSPLFFNLGIRPTVFNKTIDIPFDLSDGVGAGLSFIKDGLPVLVAFYSDCNAVSLSDVKKSVIEKCIKERKPEPSEEKEESPFSSLPLSGNGKYDDEVVATTNYYENDRDFGKKMDIVKRMNEYVGNENDLHPLQGKDREKENPKDADGVKDEENICDGEKFTDERPYFDTVKRDLLSLFDKFPHEESLERLKEGNVFVKIEYGKNRYYVVGIVAEQGKCKYICYGVPSVYSEKEPKELSGYCSFVPLSVFDMKGQGYWMMFQDAVTGKCIIKQ